MTWLLASMDTIFKNKIVHCKFFYEMWDTILEFFITSSRARIQKKIENQGKHLCSVVYDSPPPETRTRVFACILLKGELVDMGQIFLLEK
ncbi:uncharacterized protein LOC130980277 isoform X2 [Arachis stenosperma]|uniref:uncharacterized protein LOC130980277 isoform X2 n=1 Tax=Arachis stenosperma TaxID=217475 RepID=UPI0025AB7959|nr:uncharacterized protein LOC130980277 isoform X2 [Arachis stenosperma]